MNFTETGIKGLYVVDTLPVGDHRGMFARLYCKNEFNEVGLGKDIVQINQSKTSAAGTVRGMHFQHPPFAEIKIVRCLRGSVFDVAVDIRKDSPTFLKWHGEILSAENMNALYIPEGFAHGFQTLEADCEMLYLHTACYSREHEGALRYDDPILNIRWPLKVAGISERDASHPFLDESFRGVDI